MRPLLGQDSVSSSKNSMFLRIGWNSQDWTHQTDKTSETRMPSQPPPLHPFHHDLECLGDITLTGQDGTAMKITHIFHADDLVLVAFSPDTLQTVISRLNQHRRLDLSLRLHNTHALSNSMLCSQIRASSFFYWSPFSFSLQDWILSTFYCAFFDSLNWHILRALSVGSICTIYVPDCALNTAAWLNVASPALLNHAARLCQAISERCVSLLRRYLRKS